MSAFRNLFQSFCTTTSLSIRIILTRGSHFNSFSYRTHTCGELRTSHVGSHVTLCGWVLRPRVLGSVGVVFLPLKDATGTTQIVSDNEEHKEIIKSLQVESVVLVNGLVSQRPENNINKDMSTGDIEVQLHSLTVLNEADNKLPFLPLSKAYEETQLNEELKLRERYLEIRRPPLQHNLRLRSLVSKIVRQFLQEHGFVEVETPTLFKPTPEGAREFIVPTREHGQFYSLTQSPQQFKQLLMAGGIDRYFQFARCYRDEDQRSDRQPEFTQIDLEMSFVDEEGVIKLTESLVTEIFTELKICSPTFSIMTYREAMDTYGTDKPDTRYNMPFKLLSSHDQSTVQHVGFSVPHWKELTNLLKEVEIKELMKTLADHQPLIKGTILFCHCGKPQIISTNNCSFGEDCLNNPHIMSQLLDQLEGDTHIIMSYYCDNTKDDMLTALGRIRTDIGNVLQKTGLLSLVPQYEFIWINEFPLFCVEQDIIKSTHHPFTAPKNGLENSLYSTNYQELIQISAQHYDLVVNGWELGGGSIRVHNPALQEHIFNILKIDSDNFSHLLKGLRSGCPPHGGIALGLDRLIAIICGAQSIREVIAFPKSYYGRDLLGGAPATLSSDSLSVYGLTLTKK